MSSFFCRSKEWQNMKAPLESRQKIGLLSFQECRAKTIDSPEGSMPGATVYDHCLTVGLVARELLSRIDSRLRETLFPSGVELVAALHDIGKVSPGFQTKILKAGSIEVNLGVPADLDRLAGFHFAVGAAALKSCGGGISEIVGRHHGSTPESVVDAMAELYGGPPWQAERIKLITALQEMLGSQYPAITGRAMVDAVSGLVTVADWIGSGDRFLKENDCNALNIAAALDEAGFVTPLIRKNLSFKDVFGFEQNLVQKKLQDITEGPGVYIVEAPMGFGKTEAALYTGYRMLEQGCARGIYFALPTRATSDRMCTRMDRFLDVILEPDSPNRRAQLLHGTAWLRETVMGEDAAPGGSWFDQSKRGILAPFCVGTIDQALLAVMNVRHGFVRSFGLAGKVVILDEVHSYDGYTGTLLDLLVQALVELQCTVVILSATLTRKRRQDFSGYNESAGNPGDDAYPLISARLAGNQTQSFAVPIPHIGSVKIRMESCDETSFATAVKRASNGQHVLWIENTVDEAQNTFSILAARASDLGIPCGLLHSRFIQSDRQQKETDWVSLYGKEGIAHRNEGGRILVGTQVLEQSLDIDADFLVSRLAPMDMILQRTGRLWRHRENDAHRLSIGAQQEAWILTPGRTELEANPGSLGKSAKVYAPYVLCRTIEVLENVDSVDLPRDIRGLLESTYEDRPENELLGRYQHDLEKEREKLQRLARGVVGTGGKTTTDQSAPTRYAELETRDLLLIKSWRMHDGVLEITTLDEQCIRIQEPAPQGRARRSIAALLLRNIVSVPVYLAPATPRASVRLLFPYLYLGHDDESAVAVGIVGEERLVRTVSGDLVLAPSRMSYSKDFGYRSVK